MQDVIQRDAMLNAIQRVAMRDAIQRDAIQRDAIQRDAIQRAVSAGTGTDVAEAAMAEEWARAFAENGGGEGSDGGQWRRRRRPAVALDGSSTSSIAASATSLLSFPPRRFPPSVETSFPPRRAAVAPAHAAEEIEVVVSSVQGVAIELVNEGGGSSTHRWAIDQRWSICGERWRGSWQHRDALAAWLTAWDPSRRERLRARQLRVFRRKFETASANLEAAEAVLAALAPPGAEAVRSWV